MLAGSALDSAFAVANRISTAALGQHDFCLAATTAWFVRGNSRRQRRAMCLALRGNGCSLAVVTWPGCRQRGFAWLDRLIGTTNEKCPRPACCRPVPVGRHRRPAWCLRCAGMAAGRLQIRSAARHRLARAVALSQSENRRAQAGAQNSFHRRTGVGGADNRYFHGHSFGHPAGTHRRNQRGVPDRS